MKKRMFVLLGVIGIGLVIFFLADPAYSDSGPKPSMHFDIVYATSKPSSLVKPKAKLMQCKDKECLDASPLPDYGPQTFRCDENTCGSMAYGYAPYQKLVLVFTDKTRESNVFSAGSLYQEYKVTVTDSALVVTTVSLSDKPTYKGIPPQSYEDGPYKTYYPNRQLHEDGFYKDNMREGPWKTYYFDGTLGSEQFYKQGKLEGLEKEYYQNGQLRRESTYKDNKREGVAKTYYENGQLRHETLFKDNKHEGLEKEYYENGQLKSEQLNHGVNDSDTFYFIKARKEYNEDGSLKQR